MAREVVTIKDVARAARVAIGTVSRVVNGNATVRAKTRIAVMQAIEKLGYEPNALAQGMRRRLSHTIGCVLREINVPSLTEFVRSAQACFDQAGYSLLISNSGGDPVREREILRRMKGQQTDGILIGPYSQVDDGFESFLRKLNVPLVLINRDSPKWLDAVITDFRSVSRAAVEHLISLGHQRIALLTGDPLLYPARERIAGYKEAFKRAAVKYDPRLIRTPGFTADASAAALSDLFSENVQPTAVVAGGLELLPSVLRMIVQRGLRIPDDVSVIGSGDSELAELFSPPISVMRWDEKELGRVAARLLLDRLGASEVRPRQLLLPTQFVLRGSTGPAQHRRAKRDKARTA